MAETASQQDRGTAGEWGNAVAANERAAKKVRAAPGQGGEEQWRR
jgi:hypothetical protein